MPAKLTLEDAQEAAKKHGGECLSTVYINKESDLKWKCAEGHEWLARLGNVRNSGTWCPKCAGHVKQTIENMREIARSRGGECLSDQYINRKTKIKWKCAEGHEWESAPMNVITGGQWCAICSGTIKGTIENMREIARSRGGECLSVEYQNGMANLEWRCSEGHEWKATPTNVKNKKSWCPQCCATAKKSLKYLQDYAETKGGECLAQKYANLGTKVQWRCSEGHEWFAKSGHVVSGRSWCAMCSGTIKGTIEHCQTIALSRGGRCVSDEYVNAYTKLLWECSQGHQWWAMPDKIRNANHWCPNCRYKNEDECRRIIERLTGKKFPKQKPKWLDGLELDGYCEEIEISFEYQGQQHHKVIPAWHRNGEADLEAQQERDAIKAAACEDHSIDLIVIDFDTEDKLGFITGQLRAIYRKRRTSLMTARMIRKAVSPMFTIANGDRIWAELGL